MPPLESQEPVQRAPVEADPDYMFAGGDDLEAEEASAESRGDLFVEPTPEPVVETPEEDTAEAELAAENPEVEPKAEAEADPEDQKSPSVPAWRLKQEAAKRRAAEERVRLLEGKTPEGGPIKVDFGEQGRQMFDMVLDGKLDDASGLLNQLISGAVQQGVQAATNGIDSRVTEVVSRNQHMSAEDSMIASLEERFPVLNNKHGDFDASLVENVLAVRDGYINGMQLSPSDAMEQAAEMVLRAHRPTYFQEIPAQAAQAPDTRGAEAISRNVAAQQRQPPNLPQSGSTPKPPEAKIDLNQLSMEELDALPESTWRRLRGDDRL